ncbi:lysophospholipid acyltransferase family protein [Undibacterium fentianense]|uniref:1-acyl-sn-glycerol-3-phosphate acyltransferase n=1 Tax=Undibacterium fentianense TaxID=2828728 RepID=A0A941E290_9BURK|nr:lysophospholipid acyltransferase family protein [Undibacterium fentianense]MBR7799912.1 1-acyl-sn-glycerol-3-phosphate acyltransferase [Undibacterium fentianense]
MPNFRLIRVLLHVFQGVLTCALVFPFSSDARRASLVRAWSTKLLGLCRVEVRFINRSGVESTEHALIVANHVSWMDIFVINSWQACHFVAKSDIRAWPIAGWLSAQAGTIFLARGKQRDVRRIYEGLVHQLRENKRIAFFPEGTTGAQGSLLPFHANLFEAAIEAKVPVLPFALRYVDRQGRLHSAADFIGEMSFAESMRLILKQDHIIAELIQLPQISVVGMHRRELAQAAHAIVAQALGQSEEASISPC